MVYLESAGQLGNQMIQYAFARSIAEELQYSLVTVNNDVEKVFNLPPVTGKTFLEPIELKDNDQEEDLINKIISNKSNRQIHLKGFFEKYSLHSKNKEKIKKWFCLTPVEIDNNNVIGIHLRLNCFCRTKPLEYYYNILKKEKFEKIAIATDDKNHDWVKTIMKDFNNAFVLDLDRIDTLRYFKTLEKIIIGHGTYGWWLGFLSNANRVYMPKDDDNVVDLRVLDEERYVFV